MRAAVDIFAYTSAHETSVDCGVSLSRNINLKRDRWAQSAEVYIDVENKLERANESIVELLGELHRLAVLKESGGVAMSPGRASRHLITIAVWLLPADSRGRYFEEFQAELRELDKLGRRAQFVYGVRLLGRALALRRVLVSFAKSVSVADES
jgi:hypothetical protein